MLYMKFLNWANWISPQLEVKVISMNFKFKNPSHYHEENDFVFTIEEQSSSYKITYSLIQILFLWNFSMTSIVLFFSHSSYRLILSLQYSISKTLWHSWYGYIINTLKQKIIWPVAWLYKTHFKMKLQKNGSSYNEFLI